MREGDNGERGRKEEEEARLSHGGGGGGGGGRGSYTHCMEDIIPNFVGQCRKKQEKE